MLNEALAKEVERNVRRREGHRKYSRRVGRELKDMSIPPDPDPKKRRAMKAATVPASSSSSSQMEGSRAVAETPTQQNSMAGGSRKDVEGEERDEATNCDNTSLEEKKSDERTVAVTTQESLDGIREKPMRIASLDELQASSGALRWSSSGGGANDKTKKANERVRALVGLITKGGDIVVDTDSKSKLWRDMSLKRAIQSWNMKHYVRQNETLFPIFSFRGTSIT